VRCVVLSRRGRRELEKYGEEAGNETGTWKSTGSRSGADAKRGVFGVAELAIQKGEDEVDPVRQGYVGPARVETFRRKLRRNIKRKGGGSGRHGEGPWRIRVSAPTGWGIGRANLKKTVEKQSSRRVELNRAQKNQNRCASSGQQRTYASQ